MEVLDTLHVEYLKGEAPYTPPKLSYAARFQLGILRLNFAVIGRFLPAVMYKKAIKFFVTPRLRVVSPYDTLAIKLLKESKVIKIPFLKGKLHVNLWGKESNPTVLFIHGWESRGTTFKNFVSKLLDKGYRVAALDGPAHGASKSTGEETNLVEYSEAVFLTMKNLQNVHAVVGHSIGGAAATYMFARYPKIKVNRLITINTPSKMKNTFKHFYKTFWIPLPVSKRIEHHISKKFNIDLNTFSVGKEAQKINNIERSLIVHDKNDDVVSLNEGKHLFENLKNSLLLITENYGHSKLIKEPKVIDRVIRFISE